MLVYCEDNYFCYIGAEERISYKIGHTERKIHGMLDSHVLVIKVVGESVEKSTKKFQIVGIIKTFNIHLHPLLVL